MLVDSPKPSTLHAAQSTRGMRPWLPFIYVLALASPASASEFTLRVEQVPADGILVRVSLEETCTSYECGRAALSSDLSPPAPAQSFGVVPGSLGVIRGKAAEDREDSWVVLEPSGYLPLALLWRSPTVDGHLPSVPLIDKAPCRVRVTDENGDAVPKAKVKAVVSEPPAALELPRGERPTVFSTWMPWLQPANTGGDGRATVFVPAEGEVAVHAAANGYVSGAAPCHRNGLTRIGLSRASTLPFRLHDENERPLPGALARDSLGMPVAISDAEGTIELDLPTVQAAVGSAGTIHLWFETVDGAVHELAGHRAASGAAILTAAPRYSLRTGVIRLKNEHGIPPPQAWLWREPNWPWPTVHPRAATPLVGIKEGAYAILVLPGERLWFVASGTAHTVCGAPSRSDRSDGDCPTLQAAPEIEGIVVDETGSPIPDAEIWINWHDRAAASITRANSRRRGSTLIRSDATGRFTGRHVPLDLRSFGGANHHSDRRVRVQRPPYLPIPDQRLERFAADDGGYRIALKRGARVLGRVVDESTSAPVHGAEVGLGRFTDHGRRSLVLGPLDVRGGHYGKKVRTTRTDRSGRFELTTWPGLQDLVVRAPGQAFFMRPSLLVPPVDHDLGDIRLGREFQIAGIVLDQDRTPVPNATVWAAGSSTARAQSRPGADAGPRSGIAARFDTDRHGFFLVPGLAQGALVDLQISAPGFGTERRFEVSPTESESIEVTLAPEAVVAGYVTLGGDGIETRVTAFDHNGHETSWPTNDDGRFRTTGLRQGQYNLVAYPPGAMALVQVDDSRTLARHDRFTVRSGGPGEEVRSSVEAISGETIEVELELAPGERRLSGRISERGVGLAGVAVRAEGRDSVLTDGHGNYSIEDLPSGLTWVTADRQDSGSGAGRDTLKQTVVIDSKSERLDFDFSLYDVSGRVSFEDGSAAGAIEVSFRQIAGPYYRRWTTTRSDGSFDLQLAPGEYEVSSEVVHSRGSGSRAHPRRLESRTTVQVTGSTSDVEVRFGQSLRINGTIYGLSERELRGLRVEAIGDDLTIRAAEPIPGYADQFLLSDLDPGPWTLVARVGNSRRRAEKRVTLEDWDLRVHLEFEALPILSGLVRLDGQPLPGAHVLLTHGQDRAGARRSWSRHDGSFHFPDLEHDSYELAVGSETRTVSVRSDAEVIVDLRSGRIEGTAFDPASGAPLAGSTLRLWPAWAEKQDAELLGIVRTGFVDRQGRFAFDRLPEGAWEIEVDGSGSAGTIHVGAGATIQVNVP